MNSRRTRLLFLLLVSVCIFATGRLWPDIADMGMLWGGYTVNARFDDVGGLKGGDPVTMAGIGVGRVESVTLDGSMAKVVLKLKKGTTIQDDAVASILGSKYVQICGGGSDKLVGPGGLMRETESALDPERLIATYALGKI